MIEYLSIQFSPDSLFVKKILSAVVYRETIVEIRADFVELILSTKKQLM